MTNPPPRLVRDLLRVLHLLLLRLPLLLRLVTRGYRTAPTARGSPCSSRGHAALFIPSSPTPATIFLANVAPAAPAPNLHGEYIKQHVSAVLSLDLSKLLPHHYLWFFEFRKASHGDPLHSVLCHHFIFYDKPFSSSFKSSMKTWWTSTIMHPNMMSF